VKKYKSANKSSFMSGFFDTGKTKMYVNRGIGTTHVPIRFFNRPEITLLEIRRETFEKYPYFVIPAKAGIQKVLKGMDSCFRRNDDLPNFRSNSKLSKIETYVPTPP